MDEADLPLCWFSYKDWSNLTSLKWKRSWMKIAGFSDRLGNVFILGVPKATDCYQTNLSADDEGTRWGRKDETQAVGEWLKGDKPGGSHFFSEGNPVSYAIFPELLILCYWILSLGERNGAREELEGHVAGAVGWNGERKVPLPKQGSRSLEGTHGAARMTGKSVASPKKREPQHL